MSERNKAIIAYLRETGATYGQAAEAFGVSRNVVAGICNRVGLKLGRCPPEVHSQRCSEGKTRAWAKVSRADRVAFAHRNFGDWYRRGRQCA